MNRQDIRSALIAASVAALVAAPLAGADVVDSVKRAVGGKKAQDSTKRDAIARRAASRRVSRGPRGRSGPTGVTGATGATGAVVDPDAIRWRAASPYRKVTPEDGAVRLVAQCPAGNVAIDGGYTTGDAGDSIRVLGFERLTTNYDSREGYALTVRAIGGNGAFPQVRAYCATL